MNWQWLRPHDNLSHIKNFDTFLKIMSKLKPEIDNTHSPQTWVGSILESAKGRSGGVVEKQLIGAKLARRFKGLDIPNHPAHAGDRQTERAGDFAISQLCYNLT